jgi:hypothetical protein
MTDERPTICLVWRGDDEAQAKGVASNERLRPIFDSFHRLGVSCEPVIYRDERAAAVRSSLLSADGVLAWVDPIGGGEDRIVFDELLREVADRGVWVSAHPDVIDAMGTKEVLHRTRSLGWGSDSDTYLYADLDQFRGGFPASLQAGGPRVLKQRRGNGGIGVWKVEVAPEDGHGAVSVDSTVTVHEAAVRDTVTQNVRLGDFMARCQAYFGGGGCLVDQAFQPRVTEGLIRVYLVADEIVGFGRQTADTLLGQPGAAARVMGLPAPKTMHSPGAPQLQVLRARMAEWLPAMQELLGIPTAALPVLWDADFLLGPREPDGSDSYVLCEINASCVTPFPPEAVGKLTATVVARTFRARATRRES